MSIATLLVTDTARSGCKMHLLQTKRANDGTAYHPFMWTDAYQRVSEDALPEDLEISIIDASAKAADAIDGVEYWEIEKVLPALVEFLDLLADCQGSLDRSPPEDMTKNVSMQLSAARIAVQYNIALVHLYTALKQHSAVGSNAVSLLGEAAALFDSILTAPFRGLSDAFELSPDNLRAMAALCLALSDELQFLYWQKDTTIVGEKIVQISFQARYHYCLVAAICEDSMCIPTREALLNFSTIKRLYYEGMTYFLHSLEPKTTKGGSRRRKAQTAFESALEHTLRFLPGCRKGLEDELQFAVGLCLNFARLTRKGQLPHTAVAALRKRFEDHDVNYQRPVVKLPSEMKQRLDFYPPDPNEIVKTSKKPSEIDKISVSVPELEVQIQTDHVQLAMPAPGESKKDAGASFRYVQSLISVKAPNRTPADTTLAKVAPIFVIDVNSNDAPTAATLREMVFFAVQSSFMNEEDKVGLAIYGDDGNATIQWFNAKGTQLEDFQTKLMNQRGQGQFAGARGTSTLAGIMAARDAYKSISDDVGKDIIVVSDFKDSTWVSMVRDWDTWVVERAPEKFLEEPNPKDAAVKSTVRLPVHTFTVGSIATASLSRTISERTGGNCGAWLDDKATDSETQRLGHFRAWVVNVVTDAKLRVGRAPILMLMAQGDVFIHSLELVGSALPAATSNPARENVRYLLLPNIALGNTTVAVATFAIPSDCSQNDIVEMALGTLQYQQLNGAMKDVEFLLTNSSQPTLVDREFFRWLNQARLDYIEGIVSLIHPGTPTPLRARGSETIYARDSISTKEGAVCLSTVEGTTMEIFGNTEVAFISIELNRSFIELIAGEIAIKTSCFGTFRVEVAELYFVEISPRSFVRVTKNGDLITVKSVYGHANLEVKGSAGKGIENNAVPLLAPKQTSARVPNPPATPWSIAEDAFVGFRTLSPDVAAHLDAIVAVAFQRCRGLIAEQMFMLKSKIERRNRVGTLKQNKSIRRCRKFLVMHRVGDAKQRFANSLAYATGGDAFDQLKKQFDVASNLCSPLVEHKRTWAAFLFVCDSYRSVVSMRPCGIALAYQTKFQVEQVHALLGAKERAAVERELALQAKLKEAADAEKRRRQTLMSIPFSHWDVCKRNAVSIAEIRYILYAIVGRSDNPMIERFVAEFERFAALSGNERQFSAEQLVTMLCFFAENLEPADFNALSEEIADAAEFTARVVEKSRLHRALFALFQKLDKTGAGHVPWGRAVDILRYTLGDNAVVFKRIEAMTLRALAVLNSFAPKDDRSRSSRSSRTPDHEMLNGQLQLWETANENHPGSTPLLPSTTLSPIPSPWP